MTSSTEASRAVALLAARHLEGQAGVAERLLGPHDALRDGGFVRQEGAGDLVGGQPADQAQRQRRARLGRQHRVAGGEDQAQQLIADVVVERRLDVLDAGVAFVLEVAADLGVLARLHLVAAELVDRPALGRGHQPGAGVLRNPGLRPFGERGHQRVLRQLFGQADVAHHPGQARDQPGLLDPEDGLDCVVGFVGATPPA